MPAETTRFAIVGAGSIGRRHARNLRALGARDLLAVDTRADRLAEIQTESGVPGVMTLEEAWDWEPEAVFVTLPTSLHVPVALDSARRGCHLFIEKPLGSSPEGVDELVETVRRHGLVTLVGCNLRFHPGLRRLKSLLDEGAVGIPYAAHVAFGSYLPDWHPWEDHRQSYSARRELGGGVVLDAIHEIDYARWLLGAVTAVRAVAGTFGALGIETEDLATMTLDHQNGAVSHVHLDYLTRPPVRRCEVYGADGTLRLDLLTGDLELVDGSGSRLFAPPKAWEPNDMYVDELRHFLACLAGRAEPEQDVVSGAEVLRVALAVLEAAEQ